MSGAADRTPAPGRISRFLASPLALILASVVTVALVAVAGITAVRFFSDTPASAVTLGTPIPSAFALQLEASSSPFVSRGGTVTLSLRSSSSAPIERLELWEDDHPYLVIDDPSLISTDDDGRVTLSLDYVPVTAGGHLLMARATDAEGRVAQSAPMATPVLDLGSDTGESAQTAADVRLLSAPGDTFATIASRLGVPREALGTFAPIIDVDGVLPTGTVIITPVPALDRVDVPTYPVSAWASVIAAEEVDCTIRVTSSADYPLRIYGGSGNAALGDLPAGGELVLSTLPIGPTVLTGLRMGASALGTDDDRAPTAPVTATLPDVCAKGGWTGDAVISGGLLITDELVEKPYVYVSVDQGDWQRIPAAEGTTLSTAVINDLRGMLELAAYDQIDLEVWTSNGLGAQRAAAGQFCRADMTAQDPRASSQSGGECDPPGASPGSPGGGPVAVEFDLTVTIPAGSAAKPGYSTIVDPEFLPPISGAGPITLTTTAQEAGYGAVRYQFSYYPLSRNSPLLDPPGVFHSIDVPSGQATTVDPGVWQNASLTVDELAGTDDLALADELARATARENLAAGRNLVDDVFIRAIAITNSLEGNPLPLGSATRTAEVRLPSALDGTWPVIESPTVSLTPGIDESATWSSAFEPRSTWNPSIQGTSGGNVSTGVGNTCQEVITYPEAGVWSMFPTSGPFSRRAGQQGNASFPTAFNWGSDYYGYPQAPGDRLISAGIEAGSDLAQAQKLYPTTEHVYCLDVRAPTERAQDALDAARADRECTLGCVLTFMVYGAVQGFITGGPYGAVVGALAGLAVGVIAATNPQFYADLKSAWDAIAHIYNAVFDKVWGFIAATNLICLGIDSLDDDAGEFCNETVEAVGTAAISYYTGLPPRLTTSAELEAAAEGSIEDAIRLALETGLGALNLSCDTFTLNSTEASDLVRAGTGGPLGAQGTSLSGCDLFAQTLGDQVSGALQARTATILGHLIGRTPIPGLVMSPISDRLPLISITAPADSPGTLGSACPVVINTTVTEQFQATRTSFRFVPVEATVRFNYGTATGVPGVSSGATAWRAEIPVGALPQTWWKPQPDQVYNVQPVDEWEGRIFQYFDTTTRLIEETPADASVPYLRIALDSPCFAQTFVIEASKYDVGSGWFAFVNDTRPAVGFW
jgi:hypothetical protein